MNKEGSFTGRDPFDGKLKEAFRSLQVPNDKVKIYLETLNAIIERDKYAVVGKNIRYLAYAFHYGSMLSPVRDVNEDDLKNILREIPNVSNTRITIVRYILWLREQQRQPISENLVPDDWIESLTTRIIPPKTSRLDTLERLRGDEED